LLALGVHLLLLFRYVLAQSPRPASALVVLRVHVDLCFFEPVMLLRLVHLLLLLVVKESQPLLGVLTAGDSRVLLRFGTVHVFLEGSHIDPDCAISAGAAFDCGANGEPVGQGEVHSFGHVVSEVEA
ncbi:MAG: hypothetical protein ACMG6E_08675, partial [Candidatus Roizmanbacteria bacterium]